MLPDGKEFVTTEEAGAVFRVSPETIRVWIREGKFPHHIRPGRKYLVTKSDIINLLNEQHGA